MLDMDVSERVGVEVDPSGDFGVSGDNRDLPNGHQ